MCFKTKPTLNLNECVRIHAFQQLAKLACTASLPSASAVYGDDNDDYSDETDNGWVCKIPNQQQLPSTCDFFYSEH